MANTPIQNPSGWLSILTRLGITGLARWFLSDTVVPVALVDSSITLAATSSTPLIGVPATAGPQVLPAANFRLATTGPLPAGPYSMTFWISSSEGNHFTVRRRNAADAADIWSFRYSSGGGFGPGLVVLSLRLLLAVNELVVVENLNAGAAAQLYQAAIFVSAG